MTTTPDPAPVDDGRPRHRELGPPPREPARLQKIDLRGGGLQPGEVATRFDRFGRPLEAVRPESQEAADHWNEQLWHPMGGTR